MCWKSFRTSLGGAILSSLTLLACAEQPIDERQRKEGPAEMFSESEAYEGFMGRWSRQLAPQFVEFADIHGTDVVLDVGSGTGALTAAVLNGIKPSQVVGVDPSAAYVDYARTRTADNRATFEVGDGQVLRFRNATFDTTLSLLVINFIPDPDRALGEMIRVTRPGGVVAAAVWDYDEGMEMLRIFWDEAVLQNPSIEPRDERHMPFSKAGELAGLWQKHGLLEVREAPLVIPLRFQSFDDFWSPFLEGQGPAGAYVTSLPRGAQQDLQKGLARRLQGKEGEGISLSARAWAVRGIVPQ